MAALSCSRGALALHSIAIDVLRVPSIQDATRLVGQWAGAGMPESRSVLIRTHSVGKHYIDTNAWGLKAPLFGKSGRYGTEMTQLACRI